MICLKLIERLSIAYEKKKRSSGHALVLIAVIQNVCQSQLISKNTTNMKFQFLKKIPWARDVRKEGRAPSNKHDVSL